MLKYKRVSLKLSGEAMGGDKTIDFAAVAALTAEIKNAGGSLGVEGRQYHRRGPIYGAVEAAAAWIGTARIRWAMLATTINCMAMEAALKEEGVETLVLSTLHMPSFCDDFSAEKAIDAMRPGQGLPVCLRHGQAVFLNGYGRRAESCGNIRGCACAGEERGRRI